MDTRDSMHDGRASGAFWLGLVAVWAVSAVYTWFFLDHGWIPHDEGTLAHPAERVLAGELPHRDFDDTYTGGQALFNAVAFKVLGRDLMSIRHAMFGVFLCWVPAVWYLTTRTLRPALAAPVTLLAVALTLPNYPAAMPSWFNLFFACFALAGLVRWVESERRRWLILAGVAVGLSIITKIVGLYMLAGALVGLLLVDQERLPSESVERGGRALSLILSSAALLLLYLVVDLVSTGAGLRELYHYVVPALGITGLIVIREWRRPPEAVLPRARRLGVAASMLLVGAAVPVAAFLAPYAASGSLTDVYNGVFVAPMRRLSFAAYRPPTLGVAHYAIGIGVAVTLGRTLGGVWRWIVAGVLAAVAAWALLVRGPAAYLPMWFSLQGLTPVVVVAGAVMLMRPPPEGLGTLQRRKRAVALLLLAPLVLMALLQFPFAVPVYFLYFAPLSVLAGAALLSLGEGQGSPRSNPELAVVGGFFLAFLVMFVNGGSSLDMMLRPARDLETARLDLPGADLRVSPGHKETWERVASLLNQHAGDAPVYAAPDAPELYFLSDRENPTRALFDFLGVDADRSGVLDLLEQEGVKVVAINGGPSFSEPLDPALVSELERRFPQSERVAHFDVRWRE